MNIIQEIKESWGWVGIDPIEVVGENDFGNLMIKDSSGSYWRLCPYRRGPSGPQGNPGQACQFNYPIPRLKKVLRWIEKLV